MLLSYDAKMISFLLHSTFQISTTEILPLSQDMCSKTPHDRRIFTKWDHRFLHTRIYLCVLDFLNPPCTIIYPSHYNTVQYS